MTGRAEQAAATLSAVDALAVPIWPMHCVTSRAPDPPLT